MRTPGRNRRQPFTVVELVVTVAVLIIMMGILVRFVSQAQFAWNQSRTNVRMYEGARLFFDVIGRDLQSMVTSDDSGQQINYTVLEAGELPADWFLAFVTASGIGSKTTDPAKLMEIGYSFANNEITRTMTRPGIKSSNGNGYFSDWDFLNANAGTWANDGPNAESSVVISGVRSVSVQAFLPTGLEPPAALFSVVDDAADDTTKTPSRVTVTLSFFDPKMEPLPESKQNKSLRTITKTIFINRGG